jgi:hypothetical protein
MAGPVAARTDSPKSRKPDNTSIVGSPDLTPKTRDLSNPVSQTAAPAPTIRPIVDGKMDIAKALNDT